MTILDGKYVSGKILKNIKEEIEVEQLQYTHGKLNNPSIAIVMVGSNAASETYVKFKLTACEKAGIKADLLRYDDDIKEHELLREIKQLNRSTYDGFIVQLPLPDAINDEKVINSINPDKDIDGFTPTNFGKMALGLKKTKTDFYMRPATPYGVLKLLQHYHIKTRGKHVVVIGRSNIVGKPIALMLGNDFMIGRATVTSCDINTSKKLLKEETLRADIIIVAVGKPNILTDDMVKEGVIVIDVGINRVNGKIVGDVDFKNVSKKASMITPVPGGVGPMTIAALILNTVETWRVNNFIYD